MNNAFGLALPLPVYVILVSCGIVFIKMMLFDTHTTDGYEVGLTIIVVGVCFVVAFVCLGILGIEAIIYD